MTVYEVFTDMCETTGDRSEDIMEKWDEDSWEYADDSEKEEGWEYVDDDQDLNYPLYCTSFIQSIARKK